MWIESATYIQPRLSCEALAYARSQSFARKRIPLPATCSFVAQPKQRTSLRFSLAPTTPCEHSTQIPIPDPTRCVVGQIHGAARRVVCAFAKMHVVQGFSETISLRFWQRQMNATAAGWNPQPHRCHLRKMRKSYLCPMKSAQECEQGPLPSSLRDARDPRPSTSFGS